MSIISEALEKTQQYAIKHNKFKKKKKKSLYVAGFLALLLVILSISIILRAPFTYDYKTRNKKDKLSAYPSLDSISLQNVSSRYIKTKTENRPHGLPELKNILNLRGIMYMKNKPAALINGKIVFEGDAIEGVDILKISNDRIVVKSNNKEVEIRLSR